MPKGRPKRTDPGLSCPKCGRSNSVKDGFQRDIQRWRCTWVSDKGRLCKHRFQENGYRNLAEKDRAFSEFHRINKAKENGLKPDLTFQDMAVSRGHSRRTIGRWFKEWEMLKKKEERLYKKALISASKEKFTLEINSLFLQALIPPEVLVEAVAPLDRRSFVNLYWSYLKPRAYRASESYASA